MACEGGLRSEAFGHRLQANRQGEEGAVAHVEAHVDVLHAGQAGLADDLEVEAGTRFVDGPFRRRDREPRRDIGELPVCEPPVDFTAKLTTLGVTVVALWRTIVSVSGAAVRVAATDFIVTSRLPRTSPCPAKRTRG